MIVLIVGESIWSANLAVATAVKLSEVSLATSASRQVKAKPQLSK